MEPTLKNPYPNFELEKQARVLFDQLDEKRQKNPLKSSIKCSTQETIQRRELIRKYLQLYFARNPQRLQRISFEPLPHVVYERNKSPIATLFIPGHHELLRDVDRIVSSNVYVLGIDRAKNPSGILVLHNCGLIIEYEPNNFYINAK